MSDGMLFKCSEWADEHSKCQYEAVSPARSGFVVPGTTGFGLPPPPPPYCCPYPCPYCTLTPSLPRRYLDAFKFKKTAPPAALVRAQERSEAAARERADAKRAAREEAERMELEPPPADPGPPPPPPSY